MDLQLNIMAVIIEIIFLFFYILGASLSTALMDVYMKSVCTDFLHSAIFTTVHK